MKLRSFEVIIIEIIIQKYIKGPFEVEILVEFCVRVCLCATNMDGIVVRVLSVFVHRGFISGLSCCLNIMDLGMHVVVNAVRCISNTCLLVNHIVIRCT